MTLRILCCLPPLLLAACAGDAGFPSLAPRPIEALANQPEPAATPMQRVPDPALEARVRDLGAQLGAATNAWDAALRETGRLVARTGSGTVGSEAWIEAQQAIARLDVLRAPLAEVLGELDRLRFAQAESGGRTDTTRLDALWTRTSKAAAEQNAAFAELSGRIPAA